MRLELAHYFYNEKDLKPKDKNFLQNINEYYFLTKNKILNDFSTKSEHFPLPDKINDQRFKQLADMKYENNNKIEIFIMNFLDTREKVEKTWGDLKLFYDKILCTQSTESNFKNDRRQFRQDVKKYLRNINNELLIFFDIEVYVEYDWDKFKKTVEELINHLNNYKIIKK